MGDVVKLNRSTIAEIRASLRAFTMICDDCHRLSCDCPLSSELMRAKEMIRIVDSLRNAKEERYYIDNPLLAIKNNVIKALTQARRPLRFGEIIMKGTYRQRKYNILRKMVKNGEIASFVRNNSIFYALVRGNNRNTKQRKANG